MNWDFSESIAPWLLTEIVENTPEMVFVKEARELRFVLINQAAEDLLGISRQEMLGKTDYDFFPADEARFFQEKDRLVLRSGHPVEIPEEPIQTRLGPRILRTQTVPLSDRSGKQQFLLGISQDITDYVSAQEEIARSHSQLRRLTAQLQQAQEEERLHLARELHDELGQILTGVKIELAWLEDRLPTGPQAARMERHLGQALTLIDSALANVRRVATDLRPKILDDLGLKPALDWLLQETCGRAQLQTKLEYRLRQSLNKDSAFVLYRACQEALTNVVRHAQASRATVRLEALVGQQVLLEVLDDGLGCCGLRPGSLGLMGMAERVRLHGGHLELSSGPEGRGTLVRVLLPLSS